MPRAPLFQSQLPHYEAKSITLPKFDLPDVDEFDLKAKAARFAECRTIKAGLDSWREINRVNSSFEGWLKVGNALRVGKQKALRTTMANGPFGRNYCREFGLWMNENGFGEMRAPTRSIAIELAENEAAITLWRNTLPVRQRQRLIHPLSCVRRWRAETQPRDKSPEALKHDAAMVAWRRFVSCVEALPPDEAAAMWRQAQAQAEAALSLRAPPMESRSLRL